MGGGVIIWIDAMGGGELRRRDAMGGGVIIRRDAMGGLRSDDLILVENGKARIYFL